MRRYIGEKPPKKEVTAHRDSEYQNLTGYCWRPLFVMSTLENLRKSRRAFYYPITEVRFSQNILGTQLSGFSQGFLFVVFLQQSAYPSHCHKHRPHTGDSRELTTLGLRGCVWRTNPVSCLMAGSPVISCPASGSNCGLPPILGENTPDAP